MIILEFRFQENFQTASRLLEVCGLSFEFEVGRGDWGPSLIWLFEEKVTTDAHRAGLNLARDCERRDHVQRKSRPMTNLAVPQ